MKLNIIAVSIVLVFSWKFSSGCEENWYNKCQANEDCCSGNCDKAPEWEHGVCKGEVTKPGETGGPCELDWTNQCKEHNNCCSGFCDKYPDWEFGVCKPKIEPERPDCKADWYNECVEDKQCCSEFCDRPEGFQFGVCKQNVTKSEEETGGKCHLDWSNQCRGNDSCCSGFCDKYPDWEFGVCKPINKVLEINSTEPESERPAQDCKADWYNECVENKQCCSEFCDRREDFQFGVCKPKAKISEEETGEKCQLDSSNRCKGNDTSPHQ